MIPIIIVVIFLIVVFAAVYTRLCKPKPLVPGNSSKWLAYKKTNEYQSRHQKCIEKLKEIKKLVGDEQLKLLAIGRKGVGKSSFLNTVMRACDETDSTGIEQVFVTAQSQNHVSQCFTGHKVEGTNIFLVDSIGVRQLGEGQFTYDNVWDSLFQGIVDVGATVEYVENFNGQDGDRHRGTPYDGAILVEEIGTHVGNDGQLTFAKKIVKARARMSAPIPMIGVVTRIDSMGSNYSNFVELAEQKEVADAMTEIQKRLDRPCFPVRCYDDTFKYNDPWINYNALDALHFIVEQAVKFKRRKAQEN